MSKQENASDARETLKKIVHEDSAIFGMMVRTSTSGQNWAYKHVRLLISDAKNDIVDITGLVAAGWGYKLDSDDNIKSSNYVADVASNFFQSLYHKEPHFFKL